MNESHLMGWIAGALQFAVALYALRLNHRFGTARVGWSLFGAFSLLALLQLIQSTVDVNMTIDSGLKVNGVYVLISFLLLIGMMHLEGMLKGRLRVEEIEKQLRANLEIEVKAKSANLTRAIGELVAEMGETKRLVAIVEAGGEPLTAGTADGGAETVSILQPVSQPAPSSSPSDSELFAAGVMDGEWIAHF